MNHIVRLQTERKAQREVTEATAVQIANFRTFLRSAKFTGVDTDGSRKDWISTGDVDRFLADLLDTVNTPTEVR